MPTDVPAPIFMRKATLEDLDEVYAVIEDAKKLLKADGSSQWQQGYPSKLSMQQDIESNNCYVLIYGDEIMGTGNKLHPELLRLSVLEKTEGCPLARVMRRECRARGLKNVPVVYSPEQPLAPAAEFAANEGPGPQRGGAPRRQTPGSVSFVPGAAGLILAGKVIRDIVGVE